MRRAVSPALLSLTALLLFPAMVCTAEGGEEGPSQAPRIQPPPTVTFSEAELLGPLFEAPEALWDALATRDHATAAKQLVALDRTALSGATTADAAFLQAWSLLRAKRGAEAVGLLPVLQRAEHVPEDYRALTAGELLLESGKPVEAAAALQQIAADSPIYARAQLRAAEALQDAGSTREAQDIYVRLAERPDPSDGSEKALWALAQKAGLGAPAAQPYLKRLWTRYPRTGEGRQAAQALGGYPAKATSLELAQRAEALMDGGAYEGATELLAPYLGRYTDADEAACIAWYTYGRSQFKRNNVTAAAQILAPAGEKCEKIDTDRGARSLYIAGKALERKKDWAGAARAFQQIPQRYPEHSMADDGYVLAGIGWQESGDLAKAMVLWEKQVKAYPDGDLAAEGFWRLAWNSYRQGDTALAIRWAEQMAWTVPITSDPVHGMAGRYWAGRWKIYPDISNPQRINPDKKQVEAGMRDLRALCTEHPTRFYALLAAARLYELDPAGTAALERPTLSGQAGMWTLDAEVAARPELVRMSQLARLGLAQEALEELERLPADAYTPTEAALYARIQDRLNPIVAHDKLHKYLLDHPPASYSENQQAILTTAYPNLYWDLVQQAASGYGYDPRVFHALVREESSFNKDIVSWAGAQGLSQLMPATAKQVGGWLGISVTKQASFDPLTNLRIGSRYMEFLQLRFKGNMFLAVGGYNAGEGNIDKWLRERGNTPTDEFIENIPYRETRGYVKRVLGTYQTYHVLYDDGPLFIDWSAFNHQAKPASN